MIYTYYTSFKTTNLTSFLNLDCLETIKNEYLDLDNYPMIQIFALFAIKPYYTKINQE